MLRRGHSNVQPRWTASQIQIRQVLERIFCTYPTEAKNEHSNTAQLGEIRTGVDTGAASTGYTNAATTARIPEIAKLTNAIAKGGVANEASVGRIVTRIPAQTSHTSSDTANTAASFETPESLISNRGGNILQTPKTKVASRLCDL